MNKFKYNQFLFKKNYKYNISSQTSEISNSDTFSTEEHVGVCHQFVSSSHYRFFLDKNIEEESKYRDLIQTLISANEGDLIELIISNSGGNLTTTVSIINAIRGSLAFVRAIITSEAHSASSFIAVACDEVISMPHSCMLIHNPRMGNFGNFNEFIENGNFFKKYIKDFYFDIYKDFLSEEEIQDVLGGKDIWLTSDEINNRIQIRNEKRDVSKNVEEKSKEECCYDFVAECDSLVPSENANNNGKSNKKSKPKIIKKSN